MYSSEDKFIILISIELFKTINQKGRNISYTIIIHTWTHALKRMMNQRNYLLVLTIIGVPDEHFVKILTEFAMFPYFPTLYINKRDLNLDTLTLQSRRIGN